MSKREIWFKHVWITEKIGIRWWPANLKGWLVMLVEIAAIIYAYMYATAHATSDREFLTMFLGPFLIVVAIGTYLGVTRGERMR